MKTDLIILDTDPGSDDAIAILAALASKTQADYAFVSTYGNGPIGITENNLKNILNHAKFDGKIFHGADTALNGTQPNYDCYHGSDCLGGVSADLDNELKEESDISVADIIEIRTLIKQYENITYITLGALSNLARLIIEEESVFLKKNVQLLVMGGGIRHTNAPHNSEYNFYCDPEALKIVLDSNIPIKLFPFDLSVDYPILDADVELLAQKLDDSILSSLLFALLASANKNGRDHADIPDVFPVLYRMGYEEAFVFRNMTLAADEYGALKHDSCGVEIAVAVGVDDQDFLRHCLEDIFL